MSLGPCRGAKLTPIAGTKRNGMRSDDWSSSGEGKMARSFTPLSDRSSRPNTSRTALSSRASTERTRMNVL
ncbi:MAG: hypothetical protein H9W81_15790 [Enterococcus sp.]|nr:hypothetical protein [Enterococcus sp.]